MRRKARSVLVGVLYLASLLCFACTVCVLMVFLGDSGGSLQSHHAGLDPSQKGGLVIAYALASAGLAIWIGLWRWLKVEPEE